MATGVSASEFNSWVTESVGYTSTLTEVNLDDVVARFSFEGFSPEITFVIMMKKIEGASSKSAVKKMLVESIVFGLTRGFGGGKSLQRIKERTKGDGKVRLDEITNFFGITAGHGVKEDSSAITFDRIMAAFPALTHAVWKRICESVPGYVPGYDGGLPKKFRYPGSPSAMSKSDYDAHLADYIKWNVELLKVWSQNRKDSQVVDDTRIRTFCDLQFNNRLYPKQKRE